MMYIQIYKFLVELLFFSKKFIKNDVTFQHFLCCHLRNQADAVCNVKADFI